MAAIMDKPAAMTTIALRASSDMVVRFLSVVFNTQYRAHCLPLALLCLPFGRLNLIGKQLPSVCLGESDNVVAMETTMPAFRQVVRNPSRPRKLLHVVRRPLEHVGNISGRQDNGQFCRSPFPVRMFRRHGRG